jgi:hypothetical protein
VLGNVHLLREIFGSLPKLDDPILLPLEAVHPVVALDVPHAIPPQNHLPNE